MLIVHETRSLLAQVSDLVQLSDWYGQESEWGCVGVPW